MFMRPTSYFLETKRSAVGSFCGTMLYISAVYAVMRLSVCHIRVKDLQYCVKTLSRTASCIEVSPGVSQIFPPHEKIHSPPVKFMFAAGAYSWRP